MDFKKIFLIIGLAVVGYLIILQWSRDSMLREKEQQNLHVSEKKSVTVSPITSKNRESDAPVPTSNTMLSHSHPSENGRVLDDLIEVKTPQYQVKIDRYGGNIVFLALNKYPEKQDSDTPYILLNHTTNFTYVVQSGLTGQDGPDAKGLPQYSAEKSKYVLDKKEDHLAVDLHYTHDGINYTKRYTFSKDSYDIKLSILIKNTSEKIWSGNFYAQLKRDDSKDPGLAHSHGTSIVSYLGGAVRTGDSKFKKLKFDDFLSKPFSESLTGGYAAILQHYFVTAWVPNQKKQYTYTTRKVNGNNIIGFYGNAVHVEPGKQQSIDAVLYAGPKIEKPLHKLADGLDLTVDYGWLWFIAGPMFSVLQFLHALVGNWGWSIIILTAIIKLLFFPLSASSYRSMAKMRSLQPKMQQLKERYGDNKQKMSQELMALYKKEKVNPMGGCLPIIVQMPFFIALYEVLIEAVQLRQAPWILWIQDLSKMDPYFIMPLIMGGLMFIQQRLSPAPPDPMQARVMRFMPVMFTIFFLWFPAGLVIYWVTNNFLSILQQWWITKSFNTTEKKKT